MTFKTAVELTPHLRGGWQKGLRALREVDLNRVATEDTRRLKGSVDVETCLKTNHSLERQWDYAVGHQPTNLADEVVYWIEVHPANPGEVKVVLEKLAWLRAWLAKDGEHLNSMKRAYVWISSGTTSFSQRSPQARRMSQEKLRHVGGFLRIPPTF
jgi:hypothetical protein